MRHLAAGLHASFEATAAVRHHLTRGEARESALATHLKRHLPARFELGPGVVLNSKGHESRQQDILITDPNVGTPFIAEGQIGAYPIETVVGSLQVKTTIDSGEVASAVENLASVKELMPDVARGRGSLQDDALRFGQTTAKPFTAVVAFTSKVAHPTIHRAYLEANRVLSPVNRTNALFLLDEYTILWGDEEPLSIQVQPQDATRSQLLQAGRDSILFFYVALISAITSYQPPRFELQPYLNLALPPVTVYLGQWLGPAAADEL